MNEREEIIADLLELLALYEEVPDLPVAAIGSSGYCVLDDDDETGRAEIRRIAAILRKAGKKCVVTERPGRFVEVAFRSYRAFYCLRESMARYGALMSYDGAIVPALDEAA